MATLNPLPGMRLSGCDKIGTDMARITRAMREALAQVGRIGGLATTQAKKSSARANGKLGGRPMKYRPCKKAEAHRFRKNGTCYACNRSREELALV